MIVRKASTALQRVAALPPLVEREPKTAGRDWGALEWQGEVRIAADRAAGLSAPQWQQHVRTGLLERALVLGADHREGPHQERPEAARRLLAHIDALAEAGLSPEELGAFAEVADLDAAGSLWVMTILFGCLDASGAEEAFEAWVASLDPSRFVTYDGIAEVADALRIQPNPLLLQGAARWRAGSSELLCAIGLETTSLDRLPGDELPRLARTSSPLVLAAIERLIARAPKDTPRPTWRRASWMDLPVPAFAYEVARARMFERDPEPLFRLRSGDGAAASALGSYALDVIAMAGDGSDNDLALDLLRGLPTSQGLLEVMGRVGLPSLFPRLLGELASDDFDDSAHGALVTALGPRAGPRSIHEWEQAIASLPEPTKGARLRGGEPHSVRSVLDEMARSDLSARDVRVRADEVLFETGKQAQFAHVEWEGFGVSLEEALSELARLAR